MAHLILLRDVIGKGLEEALARCQQAGAQVLVVKRDGVYTPEHQTTEYVEDAYFG